MLSEPHKEVALTADPRRLGRELLDREAIPAECLQAPRDQRLELLRGMMRQGGAVNRKGICQLVLDNRTLAADAFQLIKSLGIQPTTTPPPEAHDEEVLRRSLRWGMIPGSDDSYRIWFTTSEQVFPRGLRAARLNSGRRRKQRELTRKAGF